MSGNVAFERMDVMVRGAQSRYSENGFHQYGASQQVAEFISNDRDNRQQRISQCMLVNNSMFRRSLCPSCPYIVLADGLQHVGTGQPEYAGCRGHMRVTTGMIKCFMVTTPVKVDGRRPSFSENSITNIIASQNWGTAAKNMANMVLTKSRPEYCRTADMTPMGTPIITARQIESTYAECHAKAGKRFHQVQAVGSVGGSEVPVKRASSR